MARELSSEKKLPTARSKDIFRKVYLRKLGHFIKKRISCYAKL